MLLYLELTFQDTETLVEYNIVYHYSYFVKCMVISCPIGLKSNELEWWMVLWHSLLNFYIQGLFFFFFFLLKSKCTIVAIHVCCTQALPWKSRIRITETQELCCIIICCDTRRCISIICWHFVKNEVYLYPRFRRCMIPFVWNVEVYIQFMVHQWLPPCGEGLWLMNILFVNRISLWCVWSLFFTHLQLCFKVIYVH